MKEFLVLLIEGDMVLNDVLVHTWEGNPRNGVDANMRSLVPR